MKDREDLGLDLTSHNDKFVSFLQAVIKFALKALAILMVLVILWGVADVCWIIYTKIIDEPKFLLDINDMFTTFGAFLAVLIAIEIFINIVLYLRNNILHVNLVVATALMAISRKVIVFDYEKIDALFVFATGSVVFALGITYWLILKIGRN